MNNTIMHLIENYQHGDNDAIAELLGRFDGLIRHYSYINGRYDPDLAQTIRLRIIAATKRFDPQK